ncbi:apolipoprotein N-acyltransferase [Caulobacter sp. NIBR1757]|uniref:apolipoprotein N-acyltransferase n=1 Tax=Caulobacter sp. NIBR1757 TaxID=3016000 RepID=UPI00279BE2B3|nr:Apolipoprotein N-acyltransferase [Caulobacter sp. NIBR1757]
MKISAAWKARLIALAAGAAAALAHPPFGLLPGLLGYGVIMLLVDDASETRPLRSAFLRGWLAGVAYFAIGTWWVAEAFLVDIAAHGWMAPFAVTFMAAGIALFWGLAALLYRLARVTGAWRVIVFAAAFGAAEWLRGHVLTGFPWNLPGESWRAGSLVSQSASVVGAYGLTVLTVGMAAAPALFWRAPRRPALIASGVAAALVVAMIGYGAIRFYLAPYDGINSEGGPLVRIVQPDIPQEAKYDPQSFARIVGKYLSLTRQPGADGVPDIVIWPEGAIPALAEDYLAEGTWTRAAIVDALRPGQVLLVGVARVEQAPEGPRYFNSLLVLRRDGGDLVQLGRYDKHRLVPFGEYLPLDSLLSPLGIKNLVQIGDGFAAGPRPAPLAIPGLPVMQPLICYESLYPGFTREGARASGKAPDLIVNVSNDAWFGATSGPLQHLNLASYRAIEEGVPMARATPTGVSAMVDAYGRVIPSSRIKQGGQAVVDVVLPPRVVETPYRRLGDLPFSIFLIAGSTVTAVFHWRRLKKPIRMRRAA